MTDMFFVKTVHIFTLKLIHVLMLTCFDDEICDIIVNFVMSFAMNFMINFMIFAVKLADDFMLIFISVCETEFIDQFISEFNKKHIFSNKCVKQLF